MNALDRLEKQFGGWVRLVNQEANHNKFWTFRNIPDKDGNTLVRWGRIDTAGQSGIFPMGVVLARKQSKLKKGYRLE